MTQVAIGNDGLVATWVIVVDRVLDKGEPIADMPCATHARWCSRTTVRAVVASRAVNALLYRSHVSSVSNVHVMSSEGGVRGVHALNRKDTHVNLTSPWCTLVTSTLCWANEAMAKGRKTLKINLLWRANNPPSSSDVMETRSESQKPACVGNGYRKAMAQIPVDDDIIYICGQHDASGSKPNGSSEADVVNHAKS